MGHLPGRRRYGGAVHSCEMSCAPFFLKHLKPAYVILVLEDDTHRFDPRSVPAFDKNKPLEVRRPRGMGIHLVRSAAEEISYERVGGRYRLRVVVRRDS